MEAKGEAQQLQEMKPSVDELLRNYSVKLDFSQASRKPDRLSELVDKAGRELSLDPNTDTSEIEMEIEKINLLDEQDLDAFARLFVYTHMQGHTPEEGTCGVAGKRYNNHYSGEMGLALFKTRVKKGRNTLAKAFRKSKLDMKTATEALREEHTPYHVDPQNQTVTYMFGDTSATRAVFETEEGKSQMRDWVYSTHALEVVSEEVKDKPTYQAIHLMVRYNGVVRELQLMTAEAERVANADRYHRAEKDDVAKHACCGFDQ